MVIEKKRITLVDDVYECINRKELFGKEAEEVFTVFQNEVTKHLSMVDTIINTDLKKLTDEKFYDLINNFYSVLLEEQDYLKIISKRNNKEYNRFIEIGTFMTFYDTATKGYGRSFEYWNQLYQVKYTIAVSEEADIEHHSVLRKKDIKQFVEDKSIVIVDIMTEPLNGKLELNEEVEKIPSMNLNYSSSCDICGRIHKDDDNFQIIISMLRRKLTKKRILKDMKEYIEKLKYQISDILYSDILTDDDFVVCREWFAGVSRKKWGWAEYL